MTQKQISRKIERDPDYRALKQCAKYLGKVCTPRMRKATLVFLWDMFVTHGDSR